MALQGSGKALLSQCQGSKFLRETSQGRAGIVKPIKPEISEWGHFFNMKISVLCLFICKLLSRLCSKFCWCTEGREVGQEEIWTPRNSTCCGKKIHQNEAVSVIEIMIICFAPHHAENGILSRNMILKVCHKQTYSTCRQQNYGFSIFSTIFSNLFDYL